MSALSAGSAGHQLLLRWVSGSSPLNRPAALRRVAKRMLVLWHVFIKHAVRHVPSAPQERTFYAAICMSALCDITLPFDHPSPPANTAAMVIRAARLAAILLPIARGLRHAYKGPAHR